QPEPVLAVTQRSFRQTVIAEFVDEAQIAAKTCCRVFKIDVVAVKTRSSAILQAPGGGEAGSARRVLSVEIAGAGKGGSRPLQVFQGDPPFQEMPVAVHQDMAVGHPHFPPGVEGLAEVPHLKVQVLPQVEALL